MNLATETFLSVLASSLDAAVLALLVAGVLWLAGPRFHPAWRHGLWLLVTLRLLMPTTPESPFSWRHWSAPALGISVPASQQDAEGQAGRPVGWEVAQGEADAEAVDLAAAQEVVPPRMTAPGGGGEGAEVRDAPPPFAATRGLALLWAAVAGAGLLSVALASWRFRRMLTRFECRDTDLRDRARRQLDALGHQLGLARLPRLLVTDAVAAPALARPTRPVILLPTETLRRLDDVQLRHVLLHELAHWRRGDLWTNWALCLLQALHWFNPLVWCAFRRTRLAAERAADAWALRHLGNERSPDYGETLLRLLESSPAVPGRLPGAIGVMESSRDLRARVAEIATHPRKLGGWTVAAASAAAVLIAAVALTRAPRVPDPGPATATEIEIEIEIEIEQEGAPSESGSPEAHAWKIHRLGGREYVSEASVAEFYQFERLDRQGLVRVFRHPAIEMTWQVGGDSITVNQINYRLSVRVVEYLGMAMLSTVDFATLVDPVLRPSYVRQPTHFDTVVIDPGHGGHDSGYIGPFGREKDYNLDTAQRLREALEARGFSTVMTRETDVFLTLAQRVEIANAQSDAIFIGIHFNSSGSQDASGIETYALASEWTRSEEAAPLDAMLSGNRRYAENIALANTVHAQVIGEIPSVDRGIKRARFNVLRGTEMPGIVLEGGFLSNRAEAELIHDETHRQRLAESIAEGVVRFREIAKGPAAP